MANIAPEILAELEAILAQREDHDGWFTTRELAQAGDMSDGKAKDALRALNATGRLDRKRQLRTPEDDPHYLANASVNVYRIRK